MSKLLLQVKHNVVHYRTGTLLNHKHAVCLKKVDEPSASTLSAKQEVLSIFSLDVNVQASLVCLLNAIMLHADL